MLDGGGQARLAMLACSEPPEGHARRSLRLLGDRLGGLEVVESIPEGTVRQGLKNDIKPWRSECWCIPPKESAESVCAMEDVLKTCSRGYDDGTVLAVMDGTPERRTGETRTPLPPRPGQPAAYGSGHGRNGTANLFMVYAPLEAWRHVKVTDRRRRRDFARLPADIADVHFPDRKTVPVTDSPTPTGCRPSTRRPGRRTPRGPRTASRSTTRRGTGAGLTWRRPGQTSSPGSAPPGASRTGRRW